MIRPVLSIYTEECHHNLICSLHVAGLAALSRREILPPNLVSIAKWKLLSQSRMELARETPWRLYAFARDPSHFATSTNLDRNAQECVFRL